MTKTTSTKRLSMSKVDSVGYITIVMFPAWVRLLTWSLGLEPASYKRFMARIIRLWRSNGAEWLVKYLKECVRVIQHYVSGNPIYVTDVMPVALAGGLPKVIPGPLRSLIRSGDKNTIRAVLTMASLYRVIHVNCTLKLGTITDPFKGHTSTLPKYELMKSLVLFRGLNLGTLSSEISLVLSTKAGPNSPIAMQGIVHDILAWRSSPLLPKLMEFISFHQGGERFAQILEKEFELLPECDTSNLYLGRLAIKEEAAGKARVFAITDSITQSVMKPLHLSLFSILKTIPMDGTHNQSGPLDRLRTLHSEGCIRGQTFYSYDLSAATDRLPIDLQEQVLSLLLGERYASLWKSLLVERDWILKQGPSQLQRLRYSVGQPMGALSSWAMLAVTHHVVVQIAANRVGESNFNHYALLGDDIVIANTSVAKAYHSLMTNELGVDINLSKSLVSEHSFEFAKRLVCLDGEVTPLGPKNLLVAVKSNKGIPSLLYDLHEKGFPLTEDLLNSMFQTVPTVRKSQVEGYKWSVLGPFGIVPSKSGLSAVYPSISSLDNLLTGSRFFRALAATKYSSAMRSWESNVKVTIGSITKIGSSWTHGLNSLFSIKDYDYEDSLVRSDVLDQLRHHLSDLLMRKPKPNVILNYPWESQVTLDGYARQMYDLQRDVKHLPWEERHMYALVKSVLDDSMETVPSVDPFADEKVSLPLKDCMTSVKFFTDLVQNLKDKR